jgi:hypothetical protein
LALQRKTIQSIRGEHTEHGLVILLGVIEIIHGVAEGDFTGRLAISQRYISRTSLQ